MAFSGVNIACGLVRTVNGGVLMGRLSWSRSFAPATSGASDIPARVPSRRSTGDVVSALAFEITTDRDIWVAIGSVPDASQTAGADDVARVLIRAGEARNFFCDPGDMVAWAAA